MKKKIEELAQKVYKPYSNSRDSVEVVKIAQKNGFAVAQADLKLPEQGFILVNNNVDRILGIPTKKLIVVNSNLDTADRRFVIAHELGHYFIYAEKQTMFAHRDMDGALFAQRDDIKGKDEEEQNADYFAACLLMPSESFSNAYEEIKTNCSVRNKIVMELAYKFNVPLESVSRRIKELGLESQQS